MHTLTPGPGHPPRLRAASCVGTVQESFPCRPHVHVSEPPGTVTLHTCIDFRPECVSGAESVSDAPFRSESGSPTKQVAGEAARTLAGPKQRHMILGAASLSESPGFKSRIYYITLHTDKALLSTL